MNRTRVTEPEPEGWIEEMRKDIDAMFEKDPNARFTKVMGVGK